MKEFIEKLIGRLEEEKNETYSEMTLLLDKEYLLPCNMNQIDMEEYRCSTFEEVISIVNELAEEYKGGWIPCSERLPEENGYYLITIKYYHLHNNVTMGCFFDDGEWYKIEKDDKVIAWQPLPPAFKEGE